MPNMAHSLIGGGVVNSDGMAEMVYDTKQKQNVQFRLIIQNFT